MGVLVKGRPALSFGVASARFGFITVCVMAAGASLLTWLPQSAAYKPITYPVQAIADSVTKGSPNDNSPVSIVRKGLEGVMNLQKPFYGPPGVQPTTSKSEAPTAAPEPRVSTPAPAAPTDYSKPYSGGAPASAPEPVPEAPVGEPAPAPAAPASEPAPAPAAPASQPAPTPAVTPKAQEPTPDTPAGNPNTLPKGEEPPSDTPPPSSKGQEPNFDPSASPPQGPTSSPPPAGTPGPSAPPTRHP
jgi:hypothetical protein